MPPRSGFSGASVALLLLCLIGGCSGEEDVQPRVFQAKGWLPPLRECPASCEDLFGRLEDDSSGAEGKKIQHVEIQERGEPQTGLSFLFEWASETLGQSCLYLQRGYGRESCRVEWTDHNRTLIFEPWRGTQAAEAGGTAPQCSCDSISSVWIEISSKDKHSLPCDESCSWSRPSNSPRPNEPVCVRSDGASVDDHAALVRCYDEAACPVTDDRTQMAVFRDPRATAAGLFFRMEREHPELLEKAGFSDVDDFFLAVLPSICKWTSVRHRLFAEALAARSTIYWYDEALSSPLQWHYNLIWYLGLKVPAAVVEWAMHVVTSEPPGSGFFATAGAEEYERLKGALASNRTYRDEVSEVSLAAADDIMRVWLPQVLQERLGVVPQA
eukprot:g18531.t1